MILVIIGITLLKLKITDVAVQLLLSDIDPTIPLWVRGEEIVVLAGRYAFRLALRDEPLALLHLCRGSIRNRLLRKS